MKSTSKSTLVIARDVALLENFAKTTADVYRVADVFWLRGTPTIAVKETVEFISLAYLSPVGDEKIMIIMDASQMTPAAQNKILKTVEDAPASTNFLILGTSDERILNTIKSRCVTKYLPEPARTDGIIPADIAQTLKTMFGVDAEKLDLNPKQKYDILNRLADLQMRKNANCNETNQKDNVIMEILKCVKP